MIQSSSKTYAIVSRPSFRINLMESSSPLDQGFFGMLGGIIKLLPITSLTSPKLVYGADTILEASYDKTRNTSAALPTKG